MSNFAHRCAWGAAAALCGAYLLAFAHLAPLSLQDYPNHLARAVVMNDLLFHDGLRFGAVFRYEFLAIPYILNDWLLSSLIEVAGIDNAAAAWPVLVLFSLPFALLYYMGSLKLRREEQLVAFLIALYLATNVFFLRGFLAFSLAVSMIVIVLAQIQQLRARVGPSPLRYFIYVAVLLAAYLVHLSTLIFIMGAAGAAMILRLGFWRTGKWRIECLIFAPLVALLLWHSFSGHQTLGIGDAGNHWGSLIEKLHHLDWNFRRFTRRPDSAMLGLALFCCVWLGYGMRNPRAPSRVVQEMALLALTFIVMYFAMPLNLGNATWIDVRALPMIALFVMLACLAPPDTARATPGRAAIVIGIGAAAMLACINLIYLVDHLQRLEQRTIDYRAVVAAIPGNSWVFPVYTSRTERPIKSSLHIASFALIDRQAFTPYLFSKDLGDPMQYFSYRNKPYAPDEDWYTDVGADAVDWPAILRSYDYVLVMKPFSPERIPLATAPIIENSAAALYAIGPQTFSDGRGSRAPN